LCFNAHCKVYDVFAASCAKMAEPNEMQLGATVWCQDYSYLRLFVPWTVRTLDRSYLGLFVPKTIRTLYTLDYSYHRPFVPWTVRTLDHSYPRPFVPYIDYSYSLTVSVRYVGLHGG